MATKNSNANNPENPELENNSNTNINMENNIFNEELDNAKNELKVYTEENAKLKEENEKLRKELDKFKIKSKVKNNGDKKVYEVSTPVTNFCGVVAGVHFAYGKAEVIEGHILNWFKEKGYKVEEIK